MQKYQKLCTVRHRSVVSEFLILDAGCCVAFCSGCCSVYAENEQLRARQSDRQIRQTEGIDRDKARERDRERTLGSWRALSVAHALTSD